MNFIQWCRAKAGRIITAIGALLSGVENFDITPIKTPLEDFIGHRAVMGLIVLLFGLSWVRHQQIANRHPT
jgi:hypothetical protein